MLSGLTGTGLGAAGFAAGFLAAGATRRTGARLAGFFATFLRAAGRFAGAFLRLGFAFFLAAICDLPAGGTARLEGISNRYMLIHSEPGGKGSR
jgi:hypothetical protein